MYLYETHLHTCQGSLCGTVTGAVQARKYKEWGYDGIMVTDHFFGGNTTVPRDLPWRERIEQFCIGYEDAKAEGDRIGLKVFFGWEQAYGTADFLVYGLDKEWLIAHPEIEHWTVREQFEQVDRAGGMVVQAHPFRNRSYISKISLYPKDVHAVEAVNCGNTLIDNQLALAYAEKYHLIMTGGSDSHSDYRFGGGTAFTESLSCVEDYIRQVKADNIAEIYPACERKECTAADILLPVELYE